MATLKKGNAAKTLAAATPIVLSKYAKGLLDMAIDKAIEFANNPNPNFENANAGRDAYFASVLETCNRDVKSATALIHTTMSSRRLSTMAILTALDAFFYNILKQAVFPAYIDQTQMLNMQAGKLPDTFFDNLLARESFEDTRDDEDAARRSTLPVDQREEIEESQSKPVGLDNDYMQLYSGYEVQITESGANEHSGNDYIVGQTFENFGTKEIAEGLDEIRIYFENIRTAYGRMDERMAFFVEQIENKWVRHNGSVFVALLDFGLKQRLKQAERQAAEARFYADEKMKLLKAA